MKAIIQRLSENNVQTLGVLKLYKGDKKVFECKTLELANKGNKRGVSRINAGVYEAAHRISAKYGNHLHILNVKNRSFILMHIGNFHTEIRGCVLVGEKHIDINSDGNKDVTNSRVTFKKLIKLAPKGFELEIIDECEK